MAKSRAFNCGDDVSGPPTDMPPNTILYPITPRGTALWHYGVRVNMQPFLQQFGIGKYELVCYVCVVYGIKLNNSLAMWLTYHMNENKVHCVSFNLIYRIGRWDIEIWCCIVCEVAAPKRRAGPHRNDRKQIIRGAADSKHMINKCSK